MNSTRIIKFLTLTLISGALLAIPRPPDLGIGSYILYEPSTKKIIVSFNENESVEPASLTKLMTSYVVADYLKDEFISLEDNPRISIKAWQTPGQECKPCTTMPLFSNTPGCWSTTLPTPS